MMNDDIKIIFPATDPEKTFKVFNKASIYGLLLNPDPNHPLGRLLKNESKWAQLHSLTGNNVMIAATAAPKEWSDYLKEYWEKRLGENFESTWDQWMIDLEPGIAFNFMNIFNPPLRLSQLPCLLLFTDIENIGNTKVVVRQLPNWDDEEKLFEHLKFLFDLILKCVDTEGKKERLQELHNLIDSPGALILDQTNYMIRDSFDFIKEHPSVILDTTMKVLLFLMNGNPAF